MARLHDPFPENPIPHPHLPIPFGLIVDHGVRMGHLKGKAPGGGGGSGGPRVRMTLLGNDGGDTRVLSEGLCIVGLRGREEANPLEGGGRFGRAGKAHGLIPRGWGI